MRNLFELEMVDCSGNKGIEEQIASSTVRNALIMFVTLDIEAPPALENQ